MTTTKKIKVETAIGTIMVAWHCETCDVRGRDPEPADGSEVVCWYCHGSVIIDARPAFLMILPPA